MAVIKMSDFGGMLPAVDDRLLPPNMAVYSRDAYLFSGSLIPWRLPKQLHILTAPLSRYVFRIPVDETRSKITDSSYWLEFLDKDTTVIRTPVIDDQFERYYYASPSVQPKYNTKARIAAGLDPWLLGVPTPTVAPAATPAGSSGTALAVTRSYVYTWVTAYGEESGPSPPIVQNGFIDDTWAITVTAPAAADQGTNRNITLNRIYRTVTGTNGIAVYFMVAEVAAATTSYNDSLSDATVALNIELPSDTWLPPPTDMQGIYSAANGMSVGFKGNQILFSEPYRPHAWPTTNNLTTEFPIVGIGIVGQAIVVVTQGFPVVLQGVRPDALSETVIKKAEPCTSRGSIVSAADVVYYTSLNGLIAITPYGTMVNTTDKWITRDKWLGLTPVNSLRAIMSGPMYFAFGSVYTDPDTGLDTSVDAQSGITITSPQTASQQVSTPSGGGIANPALGLLTAPNAKDIYNVLVDHWTSVSLTIQDSKVYYYDFSDQAPTLGTFFYLSKAFQQRTKSNYEVMKIWFKVPTGTTAQNGTRVVTPTINTPIPADMYGVVRVYVDGDLTTPWTTREIRSSGELLRILSGAKYEFWQWEFEGRVEIYNVQVATNVRELANA